MKAAIQTRRSRDAAISVLAVLCLIGTFGARADGQASDYDALPPLISTAGSNDTPNVLMMIDTSGSMNEDSSGTYRGSNYKLSKTVMARQAINKILEKFGPNANMGLMAFEPAPSFSYSRSGSSISAQGYEWIGNSLGSTSNYAINRGYLYIPIGSVDPYATDTDTVNRIAEFSARLGLDVVSQTPPANGYYELFKFSSSSYTSSGDYLSKRLVSDGGTPLEGTFRSALEYFNGNLSSSLRLSTITGSAASWPKTNTCSDRDFAILLTDGLPTVNADGTACANCSNSQYQSNTNRVVTQAKALADAGVKSYVIGFAVSSSGYTYLNQMAVAGGTQQAYFANNLTELLGVLESIFIDIINRTSSGTGAAVVANRGNGLSADFQALYTPEKTDGTKTVKWVGTLQGFFVDENGKFREDTDQDGLLDGYNVDRVLDFEYDTAQGKTVVHRMLSSSATSPTPVADTITSDVEEIAPLWSARDQLGVVSDVLTQRPYGDLANTGRYILTSTDGQTLLNFDHIDPVSLAALDSDEAALRAAIATKDAEIAAAEGNLSALLSNFATHQAGDVASSIADAANTSASQAISTQATMTSAQSALAAAQATYDSANAALTAANANLSQATADEAAAQAVLTSATTDKANADAAVTSTSGALTSAQTALTAATSAQAAAQAALATASGDLTAAQGVAATASANFTAADTAYSTAASAQATAQGTYNTAVTTEAGAQSAFNAAQTAATAAQNTLTTAQDDYSDADADVTSAIAAVAAAQGAVTTASSALTSAQTAESAASSVLTAAQTEATDRQNDVNTAQTAFNTADADYNAAESAYQAELALDPPCVTVNCQSALTARDAAAADRVTAQNDLDAANAALATANSDLSDAQNDYNAAASALTDAQSDLADANDDLTDAQSDEVAANNALTAAQATLTAAQAANTLAQNDLTAATASLATAQADLAAATTALNSANTALSTAQTARDDAQTALNTANADVVAAQSSYDTAVADLASANAALASATTDEATAQTNYSDALAAQSAADAALTAAQTTLTSAQTALTSATAAQATAQTAFNSAATALAAAQTAYDTAEKNYNDSVAASAWIADVQQLTADLNALIALSDTIDGMDAATRADLLSQIAAMQTALQTLLGAAPSGLNNPPLGDLINYLATLVSNLQTSANLLGNSVGVADSINELITQIDGLMTTREGYQNALVTTTQQIEQISYIKYMDDNITGQAGDADLTYTERNNVVMWMRGEEVAGLRNRTIDYDDDGTDEVWRLADIVHSTPAIVGRPSGDYYSAYGDDTYRTYIDAKFNRRQVIYTGSNDGMLHAFNGGFWDDAQKGYVTRLSTDSTSVQHPLGAELWSYIPKAALPFLQFVASPNYSHMFLVDGAPQVFDVNIFANDTDHPNGWGTILVVNMRMGGGNFTVRVDEDNDGVMEDVVIRPSVMIFDVTNPEQAPELIAELTHPNLGHSLSRPALIKYRTRTSTGSYANPSENRWLLVFGSGPTDLDSATSNQDARIFAYDLNDRAWADDWSTHPMEVNLESNAYVGDLSAADWDNDYIDDAVYFGLNSGTIASPDGRVARLRLRSDQAASGWMANASLGTLLNVDRNIVGRPLGKSDIYGRRWVTFGTGRLFTAADNASTQQQYLYGVMEPVDSSFELTFGAVSHTDIYDVTNLAVSLAGVVDNGPTYTDGNGSSVTVNSVPTLITYIQEEKQGWRHALRAPSSSPTGRSTTRPISSLNSVFYTEYVPSSDQCKPEGRGYLYDLNIMSGTVYPQNYLSTYTQANGTVYISNSLDMGPGMLGDPELVGTSILTHGSGGNAELTAPTIEASSMRRQSWRQIFDFGF